MAVEHDSGARVSEGRFSRLFENLSAGLAVADWDERVEFCNPAYCELLGYPEDELRRMLLGDLVHPSERAFNDREMQRLKRGEIHSFAVETRYVSTRFAELWVRRLVSVCRGDGEAKGQILEQIMPFDGRKREDSRTQLFNDLENAMAHSTTPDELAEFALGSVGRFMAVDGCLLGEVDEANDDITLRYVWSAYDGTDVKQFRIGDYFSHGDGSPLKGEVLVLDDARLGGRPAPFASAILAPFLRKGKTLAILAAMAKNTRHWDRADIRAVRGVVARVWPAVEQARMTDQLRANKEELRLINERFETALETSPVVLFTQGLDLRYTWIHNPALGHLAEQVVGKTDYDLFERAEDAQRLESMKQAVLDSGKERREEASVMHEGKMRWYDLSVKPKFVAGKIDGVLCAAVDITEQREVQEALKRSEEEFRQIANALPQLIWVAGQDGKTNWCNDRWSQFAGKSLQECSEQRWDGLVHPEDCATAYEKWLRCLQQGTTFRAEHRCRRRDGIWRWFLVQAEPLCNEDGKVTRWLGACTDVDDQKTAERMLQNSNLDLEQFAYVASHDLQEPLRSIVVYADLLKTHYAGQFDGDARECVDYLQIAGMRMHRLIQDLLAYARAGGVGLDAKPVDAESALAIALENLRQQIIESGASVTWDALPILPTADGFLTHVFQNLVSNGIRYSRRDAKPAVHVSAYPSDGEWVFCVSDNGEGIKPQYRDKVFQLFARLHGREISGSGIGLAAVRRSVERHSGRVWFESEPGKGSKFFFSLPLRAAMGNAATQ